MRIVHLASIGLFLLILPVMNSFPSYGYEPEPLLDTSLFQMGSGPSSVSPTGDEIQPNDVAVIRHPAKTPKKAERAKRSIVFVLPEGFLPKTLEVYFSHDDLREKIHSGVHQPLEKVTVEIPIEMKGTVQFLINGLFIEERSF